MSGGSAYRLKAAELAARATTEQDPSTRAELESLALAYLRLADQADRNQASDLVYETPPSRNNEDSQPE
jgi:hypothetical protein